MSNPFKTQPLPDFTGKVVVLYLENRTYEHVVVLDSPEFTMQGGRLFLTGEIPEGVSPNDWASRISSNVAWDRIEEYLVFASLDDYLSRAAVAMDENMLQ